MKKIKNASVVTCSRQFLVCLYRSTTSTKSTIGKRTVIMSLLDRMWTAAFPPFPKADRQKPKMPPQCPFLNKTKRHLSTSPSHQGSPMFGGRNRNSRRLAFAFKLLSTTTYCSPLRSIQKSSTADHPLGTTSTRSQLRKREASKIIGNPCFEKWSSVGN